MVKAIENKTDNQASRVQGPPDRGRSCRLLI